MKLVWPVYTIRRIIEKKRVLEENAHVAGYCQVDGRVNTDFGRENRARFGKWHWLSGTGVANGAFRACTRMNRKKEKTTTRAVERVMMISSTKITSRRRRCGCSVTNNERTIENRENIPAKYSPILSSISLYLARNHQPLEFSISHF